MQGIAQLGESGVGMVGEMFAQGVLLFRRNGAFAACPVGKGRNGAEWFAAGEEFLDERQRDAQTIGDLLAGGIALVVGIHDAVANIHGECCHMGKTYHKRGKMAACFLT